MSVSRFMRRSTGVVVAVGFLVSFLASARAATPFVLETVDRGETFPSSDCFPAGYTGVDTSGTWNIPDGDPNGITIGPLPLPIDGGVIEDVMLGLSILHTWVGDLRVELSYDVDGDGTPDVGPVAVLCRPQLAGCPSDGCCGCDGDLQGLPYLFSDEGPEPLADPDCQASFDGTCYLPAPESPHPFSVFDGLPKGGDFFLFAADGSSGDVGSISTIYIMVLAVEGDVGSDSSLELDANGTPHIAYYDWSNEDLRYARKLGAEWVYEIVDGVGTNRGDYCSLALDTWGQPHIAYELGGSGHLLYAALVDGAWVVETADATLGMHSLECSLALDALDNPHVAYHGLQELRYAQKFEGAWIIETVDPLGTSVGSDPSLTLDSNGNPHVAYFDFANGNPKYARRILGQWIVEIVDSSPNFAGASPSLALDAAGVPHVSFYDSAIDAPMYARRLGGSWVIETVDSSANSAGQYTSLQLDVWGDPHIAYSDWTAFDLFYAHKVGGSWEVETIDGGPTGAGSYASLKLDAQGNPCVAYYDITLGDLRFADSRVRLIAPGPRDTLAVGSLRPIEWTGRGPVDVKLSVDGGQTFDVLSSALVDHHWPWLVPHAPTRFALLRIERADPFSTAETDSFFTIDASIVLQQLRVAPPEDGSPGTIVIWKTRPAVPDLAGYRLERSTDPDAWDILAALTPESRFHDVTGRPGARYRLTAVNGLGEEFVLGEVMFSPAAPLTATPLPFRSGKLDIVFTTFAGPGAAPGDAQVDLFDISGRLVRRIARGSYPVGVHSVTWDGLDARGVRAATGVYFLRTLSGGHQETMKVTVLR